MDNCAPPFWRPRVTEQGTDPALIRFLPQTSLYMHRLSYFMHELVMPNSQFIYQRCALIVGQTHIERDCRLCRISKELAQQSTQRVLARKLCAKSIYISNILVIDDQADSSNNNRVMPYCYDQRVDKLLGNSCNYIDLIHGRNLLLQAEWRWYCDADDGLYLDLSYGISRFQLSSAIYNGDSEKIHQLTAHMYPLSYTMLNDRPRSPQELDKLVDIMVLAHG